MVVIFFLNYIDFSKFPQGAQGDRDSSGSVSFAGRCREGRLHVLPIGFLEASGWPQLETGFWGLDNTFDLI